jgi:hypothetical protein
MKIWNNPRQKPPKQEVKILVYIVCSHTVKTGSDATDQVTEKLIFPFVLRGFKSVILSKE